MNDIEEDPKSFEFREAVPWKELGLNDYPEIIKRPMDLRTCRKNLVKGKFKRYEDYFKDISLIWDNCKTYNIQGSDIYKLAEGMEKCAKRAINKGKEDIGLVKKVSSKTKTNSKEERKNGGAKPPAGADDAEMDDVEMSQDNNGKAEDHKEEEDEESDGDDVTFEEKVAFTEKVRRLTNEGLTRLVKKVKEKCKDALEDVDSEKLHIQVDKIDKTSFGILS